MEVLETIAAFRQARAGRGQLGFVPTMGYLHDGHLGMVRRARAECDIVAVSIFVNPTQFAPHEDLSRYPRDLDHDLELLRDAAADLIFVPDAAEIYPEGFGTLIDVQGVTDILEGAARPGHFQGVATIVCKLLNIVQPARAYFGQKDAQQAVVVRKLVRDLDIPTEIVVCPTVREQDGLAMSSRNAYLSAEERRAAPVLYRALNAAQQRYIAGEREAEPLRRLMRATIDAEPLALVDYISVADRQTLREIDQLDAGGALLSMAVRIGKTRLIDNLILG